MVSEKPPKVGIMDRPQWMGLALGEIELRTIAVLLYLGVRTSKKTLDVVGESSQGNSIYHLSKSLCNNGRI